MTVTETGPTGPSASGASGTPAPRRPRARGSRAAILIAGGTALLLAVLVVAVVVVGAGRDTGSGAAPYRDEGVTGRLTLCDASGRPVTSGSVADDGFSTVLGASQVETTAGTTATLFAYQPREGTGASEWTGLALSAPGAVDSSPAELAVGPGSTTLAQFLGGYPATWDGWVQLRLVTASPEAGASPTYDAVDVQIDGDHWRAADPGTATCPA